MTFLQFLNTLENTLENISVHGREDVDRMNAIFMAINQQRQQIFAAMKKDGEESGGQNDIGVDSGDNG